MPLGKRLLTALLLAYLTLVTCPVSWAATPAVFSDQAFQTSQKQGRPILVEITASWCPVCAKQRPILSRLLADPRFQDLVVYNVDFDTQKDAVRALGAHMQSTLIVFNGRTEKGRSTGVSDPAAIEGLLAKTNG
jgi:thiol-disulfide isomerase/thioredoxin